MARFNKIYAGPTQEGMPQVRELLCAAAILPGTILIISSGAFAQAGANANGKIHIAQDNYLLLKGVDDAWAANDRIIGMELLDDQLFNVRVPTGVNVALGSPLTTSSVGKLVLATTGQRTMFFAEEAYNNTSGSDQLVRARVAKSNIAAA